jgi:MFS family permease
MLFGPDASAFVLTMYTVGLFFIIGPYAALLFYMGESFPTRIRGTGAAFVNAMGPLGAILGSALLTAFLSTGASMTTSAFFAGAIAVFLSGVLMLGTRKVEDRARPKSWGREPSKGPQKKSRHRVYVSSPSAPPPPFVGSICPTVVE